MSIGLHNTDKDRSLSSRSQDQTAGMPKEQEQKKEPALRGTFASVMLLGAFIVVTWAAVFVLFLVRQ